MPGDPESAARSELPSAAGAPRSRDRFATPDRAADAPRSPERKDQRLPPGRHGLGREEVIANQRARLLAATAQAVTEVGYSSLTVGEITKRAAVSRVTFYEIFAGKNELLAAAFAEALGSLRAAIATSCATRAWPENVIAGVRAAVEFAAASPAEAALLTVDGLAVEPELGPSLHAANDQLAAMLRGARDAASAEELPALTEQALIGGASAVIGAHLAGELGGSTAGLSAQLAQLILSPYLGASRAADLVTA